MTEVEVWTDLDLSAITTFALDKDTLNDIALAYREDRKKNMLAKVQQHDLSPMKPLKQATIDAKRGLRSKSARGLAKASRTLNPTQKELLKRGQLKKRSLSKIQRGFTALRLRPLARGFRPQTSF